MPSKTTLPPSEAMTHVFYEMRMMIEARKLLNRAQKHTPEYNLFLEGFLIHARCLYEFFATKRKDVLKPSDFGISKISRLDAENPLYKRMHREIAHLTQERHLNASLKGWDLSVVWKLVQPSCILFLVEIQNRKDQLAPELGATLSALLDNFARSETNLIKVDTQLGDCSLSSSSTAIVSITSHRDPDTRRCTSTGSPEGVSLML